MTVLKPNNNGIEGYEASLTPSQPMMFKGAVNYRRFDYNAYGISHFYRFTVTQELLDTALVFPDATVDILFRCGKGPLTARCYGTVLRMKSIRCIEILQPGDDIFGIRFFPGKAYLPGGYPIANTIDTSVDMVEITKDRLMLEAVAQHPHFGKQIKFLLTSYLTDFQSRYTFAERPYTYSLVNEIMRQRGNITIIELARKLGCSTRYINELFHREIGLPPKLFARIIRFQNVLDALSSNTAISDIACDLGYYDQSHLLKEFKYFTGMSPITYRKAVLDLH